MTTFGANFLNFHEEYVECLEVLNYMEELERARKSYQEQMARKLTFVLRLCRGKPNL